MSVVLFRFHWDALYMSLYIGMHCTCHRVRRCGAPRSLSPAVDDQALRMLSGCADHGLNVRCTFVLGVVCQIRSSN